jgi:Zn-dependent protease with chaperone function
MSNTEAPQRQGFSHSKRRIVFEILLVLAFLGVALLGLRGCAGVASSWVVASIPTSLDASLGESAAELMKARYSISQDPKYTTLAHDGWNELLSAMNPDEKLIVSSPVLFVVDGPEENAFALPGGKVFLFSGLVERGRDDAAMIQGVLAHELGHAIKRHGVRGLVNDSLYSILFSVFLGGFDPLIVGLAGSASKLEGLRYSRSMEEEADEFAIELLQRLEKSPEGLARFLERSESINIPAWLSTHPNSKERAAKIRKLSQ